MTLPAGAFPPRAVLLTVLGAYARQFDDDWMSIAGLIRLMGELGVDEQTVRSAIARFKRRGIIESERRDRTAGYRVSASGRTLLEQGDARIYGRPQAAPLEDGWVLATYSVPDSKRADRHLLRAQLSWLGYGNLSAAVWLAPWHTAEDTRATLRRLGLDDYVKLFHAHYDAFGTPADLVAQCWDLDALAARYRAFLTATEALDRCRQDGCLPRGSEALVDHVRILSLWRPLPFLDAGLPAEGLPPGWPGLQAWETFHRLVALLAEPASACVREMVSNPAAAALA